MKILLDTDTCIELIRRRIPGVLDKLKHYSPREVGISSITLSELSFGVARSSQSEKNQAALEQFLSALEVAPFDEEAAREYGSIRAELQKRGLAIGALDMLIGAHAKSLGVSLVTHNTREFSRIDGLRLEDWTT